MRVRSAVVPVAGLGTRFLPATRSIPKVMIPVLDRPAVHHTVEEASRAGIEHIVFVISHGQEAVGRYFDRLSELERALVRAGHHAISEQMVRISDMAEIEFVYQEQLLGLGHAVLTARSAIGEEPFAVFLPDDLIWSDTPTIGDMMSLFAEYDATVIAVKEVSDAAVPSLGIIDPRPLDRLVYEIAGMVEKPRLEDAPSNLAIIGRYILPPEVFDALDRTEPGALGEVQLTDAISSLLPTHGAYAYRFPGAHFDVGTPLGLLKASVYAALQREDLSDDFREWAKGVI